MSRIWAFIRRLLGHRDHTEVTPPPLPPPVVVVPPPVAQPPPPPVARPRLGQLHIWCEAYDGTRADSQLAKLGWPADKVWIHTWDSATKWSNFGRRVLSIKNPNANGTNRWDHPIADWRSAIDGFCRVAKASACSAVSIDLENWLISTGPQLVKYLYEAAHSVGLPVILVPRLGLDHLLTARDDNWAWTRPPPRANLTPRQVCDWLNHYVDVDCQWDYGTSAQVFVDARTYLDGLGYTVPIVPMMDGAGRDGQQRIPDAAAAAMVRVLWREFGSLGIFNPHNLGPQFVAALQEVRAQP